MLLRTLWDKRPTRRRRSIIRALFPACFFLLLANPAPAASPCDAGSCLDAVVVGVTDGDTVTLLMEEGGSRYQVRLRLKDVAAPERDRPWGAQSTRALSGKILRRQVRVMTQGKDQYGRMLGRIYLDGRDINREMVREGHAWAFRRHLSDRSLLEAERRAQASRAGLWSLPDARDASSEGRTGSGKRPDATARVLRPPASSVPRACGKKTRCHEMTSCAEARFYLNKCGAPIDGDRDGIPCERGVCSKSR